MAGDRPSPPAERRPSRLPRAVSIRIAKRTLRLSLLLVAAVLMVGLGGCGVEHRATHTDVTQDDLEAGNEPYFNVGQVTYQVQLARVLNPFTTDDVPYLAGVSQAQDLKPTQLWYGVFLWAKNQSTTSQRTADRFELADSGGTVFQPTPLNASTNPFAWTSESLGQNNIEPAADSIAGNGSPGGSLVLFKVDTSVFSNRPLTLLVFAPGSSKPSRVALDL